MAASPRPPSWAIGRTVLSAGVLGETALPWFCFSVRGTQTRLWVCGARDRWFNRLTKDGQPYQGWSRGGVNR